VFYFINSGSGPPGMLLLDKVLMSYDMSFCRKCDIHSSGIGCIPIGQFPGGTL
jgi:hypothetical protein